MAKSRKQLDRVLAAVRKRFGAESAVVLGAEDIGVSEVLPTGVDVLDHYTLGIGGLAVGRVSEISGMEACGKTSLAYSAIGTAQREDALVAVVDSEYSFDETRARTFGVDPSAMILTRPESMEEALDEMQAMLAAHDAKAQPMLIVWDSLAAAPTKAEVEGDTGDVRDMRAKILSGAMRKITPLLLAKRAHLLIVNQIREKIGVMYGPKTVTPGGHAVKFHASQRIEFFGGKKVTRGKKDADEEHVGKVVTIVTTKNRFATPYRKARVLLMYESGFDNDWSTLELAKTRGAVDARAKGEEAVERAREWLVGGAVSAGGSNAPAREEDTAAVEEEDGGDDDV